MRWCIKGIVLYKGETMIGEAFLIWASLTAANFLYQGFLVKKPDWDQAVGFSLMQGIAVAACVIELSR